MKNLLENALRDAYEELRRKNPEFCGCDLCREDVMAYALNKMRPRYTGGGDLGVALANLELQRDDARATIAVTLLEGMRRVGANPHRLQDGPRSRMARGTT
jgi:competence protein ComFB